MIETVLFILGLSAVGIALAAYYRIAKLKAEKRGCDEALREAESKSSRLREFLSDFSTALRGDAGVDGGIRNMAEYAAKQLGADAVGIYDFRDNEVWGAGVYGSYPLVHTDDPKVFLDSRALLRAMKQERYRCGDGFFGRAAEDKKPHLISEGWHDARIGEFIGVEQVGSVLLFPFCREDGSEVGLLCAVNARDHRAFTNKDVELCRTLSGQLVISRELIHAYGELSRKDRLDQELAFVRQLQCSMLPEAFPTWEMFSVNAYTSPAKEVNGDFYDFVEIDENRLLIVLGDATGKGLPACMLTAMTRSLIRAMADNFTTLSDFLSSVNRKLYRNTEDGRFVTLGCCLLDRRNALLEFGRAGHTELMTFVHDHIRLIAPDGTALGILPEEFAEFDTLCLAVTPGTSLLMFSDGITEATDRNKEEFGVERLSREFADACRENLSPAEVIRRILDRVESYSGGEQEDDQTLALIRCIG